MAGSVTDLPNFQVLEGLAAESKCSGIVRRADDSKGEGDMGARFGRLLLLVALVVAVPGARAGAAPKAGDPPGNNGTVKIDQSDPPDEDRGNEPIGDNCQFSLKFYGFDLNQKADITFTAHPPSGRKVLLVDKGDDGTGRLISDDAAGGGQDDDAVIPYDLTSAVQGLKAAQHGYHIKLSVDVKEAPGGAKHKVFWIKCNPAPAASLRTASAAGTPGTAGTAGTAGTTGATAAPGTSVLGQGATTPAAPGALPRTGADPYPLLATGMWSLVAGGVALVAGRRLRHA
jgi:hypothetical protein